MKAFGREARELLKANEILRLASASFGARVGRDEMLSVAIER